jgi:ABC-2 type transport system permease protein
MKTIRFLLQKEFLQIRRNRTILPMIIVVPIVQLLILVNAASLEMKNIDLCFVDQDLSSSSRGLQAKFNGSPFFKVMGNTFSFSEGESYLKDGSADIVIRIPQGFEKRLLKENKSEVQILANAINGSTASIGNAYAMQIIAGYNRDLVVDWYGVQKNMISSKTIQVIPAFWFNPELNYKVFMVPGILVLLVTLIGMMLSAFNIVREKEMGTLEQINVTPIKKHQFIIGKLLPFWIIALFELGFGLTIGKLLFDIPMLGSLWLLFFVAGIYLLAMQGISLLISNSVSTQQQAMFMMFFFMIVFMMMSGLFTPAESMPQWGQWINKLNPIYYFMRVIRMILIKGSGFMDIWREIVSLAVLAVSMLSLAVWRYRKTT